MSKIVLYLTNIAKNSPPLSTSTDGGVSCVSHPYHINTFLNIITISFLVVVAFLLIYQDKN